MDRIIENEIKLATALLKHLDGSSEEEVREYLEELEVADIDAMVTDLDDLKAVLCRIHKHYDGGLERPERIDLDLHFTHITKAAKERILTMCGFTDFFKSDDGHLVSLVGNMGYDFAGMSAKIEFTSLPTSQHEDDLEIEEARQKGELIEDTDEDETEED